MIFVLKRFLKMWLILMVIQLFLSLSAATYQYWQTDYEYWQPENSNFNRSYLMCDKYYCSEIRMEDLVDRQESCCICNSKPSWEVYDTTINLNIEYIRRNGESIIYEDTKAQNAEHLTLIHRSGHMTKMPRNICDFGSRIVTIDLQNNFLSEVGNLSCLRILDTLDLSYNNIKHISNKTFIGLENLRILRITNSSLKVLEPASVTGDNLEIHIVDFSHNKLEILEFSNAISESDFCKLDYSENEITEIVNTNNFKIEEDKKYRGGFVDMNKNSFTKFIDFTKLGILDITILGKVMEYGFIMTDMKWDCDCQMEPYLELAEPYLAKMWRDYFNISCWNPPELRGQFIVDLIKKDRLDLFICNLTEEDKCPRDCYCFYQPKQRRTVVDCSNANFESLPPFVPEKSNLTLILKNNSITHLENRTYLQYTTVIDVSYNRISFIDPDAVSSLPSSIISINFDENALSAIPNDFQTLDPCKISFGKVLVKCDCDTLWQKDWIGKSEQAGCTNQTVFICEGIGLSVALIVKEDICQTETDNTLSTTISIILAVLTVFILVIASTVYTFRYEIFIWYRSHTRSKSHSKVTPLPLYDAYVSFPEENDEIRHWVLCCLKPDLELAGYNLYIPCLHSVGGSVKEEHTITNVSCSKNFLVILSDNLEDDGPYWTQIEWKHVWHNFKENPDRQIIVLNFDQMETNDEIDQRLRAFVRLGYDMDFSNRKHDLIFQIKDRLGCPLKSTRQHANANKRFSPKYLVTKETAVKEDKQPFVQLVNAKSRFNPKHLFTIGENIIKDQEHYQKRLFNKSLKSDNNEIRNQDVELQILDM